MRGAFVAVLLCCTAAAHAAEPKLRRTEEAASGAGEVRLKAKGPLVVRARTGEASIEVVASKDGAVRAEVLEPAGVKVSLRRAGGERLDLEFDGHNVLKKGRVRLEVPPKSRLDLESASGSISVAKVLGEVRVRTASGAVDLSGTAGVDAESIEGELRVSGARGPVRVHTVSGKVRLALEGSAPEADLETTSGDLELSGHCGQGCRIDVDSVSGALVLRLDAKSSFELRFVSHQGKLLDPGALLRQSEPEQRGEDAWRTATLGDGAGAIECETFSGYVTLAGPPAEKK